MVFVEIARNIMHGQKTNETVLQESVENNTMTREISRKQQC